MIFPMFQSVVSTGERSQVSGAAGPVSWGREAQAGLSKCSTQCNYRVEAANNNLNGVEGCSVVNNGLSRK